MVEEDFWIELEYRIGMEFAGLPDRRYRRIGCDGFTPQKYEFDGERLCVTGRAWMIGVKLPEWVFVLWLPRGVRDVESMDWAAWLPAKNVTKWMSFDMEAGTIEMDPGVAVADEM